MHILYHRLCAGEDSVTDNFAEQNFRDPASFASLSPAFESLLLNRKTPSRGVFLLRCAGEDSNLRRINPPDLQSGALDHSATDAILLPIRFYQI